MFSRLFLSLAILTFFEGDRAPPPDRAEPAAAVLLDRGRAAQRRRLVAERFAPTFYQETLDASRDFIRAFDYDGDWVGANNADHVRDFPAAAVVYYTVLETETHWFVHYMPYHPVDYKRIGGHQHDTESALVVVRKEGAAARLELVETRFHKVWYQYVPEGTTTVHGGRDDIDGPVHIDEDGRPAIYIQRVGHGLCGGLAPTSAVRELELRCDHQRRPQLVDGGVVYRYAGLAGYPMPDRTRQTVGYALEEIGTSLWAHRRDAASFSSTADFIGARCASTPFRCPHALGLFLCSGALLRDSAEAPWAQTPGEGASALGDQFFDPAYTLARRLRFTAPFSLDYVHNPYLGIGRKESL